MIVMVREDILTIYEDLKKLGLSELDASLVADCINMQKACTWQNSDPITPEAVDKANDYLSQKNINMRIIVSPSRFDKFIWETKKLR